MDVASVVYFAFYFASAAASNAIIIWNRVVSCVGCWRWPRWWWWLIIFTQYYNYYSSRFYFYYFCHCGGCRNDSFCNNNNRF